MLVNWLKLWLLRVTYDIWHMICPIDLAKECQYSWKKHYFCVCLWGFQILDWLKRCKWASFNLLRAWIEQNSRKRVNSRSLFVLRCQSSWFLGFCTWTVSYHQFSVSTDCSWQSVELRGLNYEPRAMISVFVSVSISHWFCFRRELWLIHWFIFSWKC